MPLPLIIVAGAAIAVLAAVESNNNIAQYKKMCDNPQYKKMYDRFQDHCKFTSQAIDNICKMEPTIRVSFERFTQVIEKIHNRPQFKQFDINHVKLPNYDAKELKEFSISPELKSGWIKKWLEQATEAAAEKENKKICTYLNNFFNVSKKFHAILADTNSRCTEHFNKLKAIVEVNHKVNWSDFTAEERRTAEDAVLLVAVLNDMCKINPILTVENESSIIAEINKATISANAALKNIN